MKKDEFGGWEFEEDEREALADILKKFDSKQVEPFLTMLEFICFQMKIWKDLPTYQDVKEYAKPILHSFNKTIEYLNLLEKQQLAKGIPFGFPQFAGSDPDAEDNRHRSSYVLDIIKNAETSRISLEELKTQIERQLQVWKSRRYRPKADSHSFVYDMSRRYLEYFNEKPTAYPGGIFFKIVQKTREILEIKHEDPRKTIEQALLKLKAKAP